MVLSGLGVGDVYFFSFLEDVEAKPLNEKVLMRSVNCVRRFNILTITTKKSNVMCAVSYLSKLVRRLWKC